MKIVGQLVCGPREADRWLEETLKEFARLCDDVVVCLCHATEKEKALVARYDFRLYEDDREWGKQQPNIKTDLLRRIKKLGADYILALDADETVPSLDRAELERVAETRDALQLYVVDLWNDEAHYSKALSFWNVRGYNPNASPDTQFLRKPVHCGNAPPYFYSIRAKTSYIPHILLHRGLMRRDDRLRKVARYDQYDPNAVHKSRDYYDALLEDGAGSPYAQDEVLAKLRAYCGKL